MERSFLEEIEKETVIEIYESQQCELIGMPFYNKANREDIFEEKLNSSQ
jgi:type III restriction enzyme